MNLRELEIKDAPYMLEWMHDDSVVKNLRGKFGSKTIEDAKKFIIDSQSLKHDVHLAIVSDEDEYMGTVSLKNIDNNNKSAEFAITVRSSAMGKGYSWYGMDEIIKRAFRDYGLENVYWCVDKNNTRAVRFYDKHNFHEALDIPIEVLNRYKEMNNLKWYSILKGDVQEERKAVAGCKIIHIKTIPTVDSGELSFFESGNEIPFNIKRALLCSFYFIF